MSNQGRVGAEFDSGKPIESKRDDLLDRASFAESLTELMLSPKQNDCLIVGLYGGWGTGKTSIINMVVENVESRRQDQPIPVHFNPWLFSGRQDLISQFFAEFQAALKEDEEGKIWDKLGGKLVKYLKLLGRAKPLLHILPVVLSAANSEADSSAFTQVSAAASTLLDTTLVSDHEDEGDRSLIRARNELDKQLKDLNRKIVVVIDDIDRLSDPEIREMFQLVRLVADFPNTTYLLAFDKDVVIAALDNFQKERGYQYLEKVVQVPMDIPAMSKDAILALLFQNLNTTLAGTREDLFDKSHWNEVLHAGLKSLFTNLRDVVRFSNTFSFQYKMLEGEVDPVDMIAITAIQVFEPDVYRVIRHNLDAFTGGFTMETNPFTVVERSELSTIYEAATSKPRKTDRSNLKSLLEKLFPRLRYAHSESAGSWPEGETAREHCRISNPEFATRYFRYSIPEGQISQSKIRSVLSLTSDPLRFIEEAKKLEAEGLLSNFLEHLSDSLAEVDNSNVIESIISFCELGEIVSYKRVGRWSLGIWDVRNAVEKLVSKFDSESERFDVLRQCVLRSGKCHFALMYMVGQIRFQHGLEKDTDRMLPEDRRTVDSAHLAELQKAVLQKVEQAFEDDSLVESDYLSGLLHNVRRWGASDLQSKILRRVMEREEWLLAFIRSAINTRESVFGPLQVQFYMDIDTISELIDPATIEQKLRLLAQSSRFGELPKISQSAVTLFLDTFNGNIKDAGEQ